MFSVCAFDGCCRSRAWISIFFYLFKLKIGNERTKKKDAKKRKQQAILIGSLNRYSSFTWVNKMYSHFHLRHILCMHAFRVLSFRFMMHNSEFSRETGIVQIAVCCCLCFLFDYIRTRLVPIVMCEWVRERARQSIATDRNKCRLIDLMTTDGKNDIAAKRDWTECATWYIHVCVANATHSMCVCVWLHAWRK